MKVRRGYLPTITNKIMNNALNGYELRQVCNAIRKEIEDSKLRAEKYVGITETEREIINGRIVALESALKKIRGDK